MRRVSLTLLLLFSLSLTAQLTEEALVEQKRFIEAKRDALLGKTEEATRQFEELAEQRPKDDAVHFELARLYFTAGENERAIQAMSRAYRQRKTDVYATFLAELYQATGRHAEGAELYAERIKANPALEENYMERAAFLVRAQEIKEAIGVYDELEERIGTNPELTRRKHALYLGQGDTKRAERELTALIAAFPRKIDYQHLLAGFYTSQGQADKARDVYRDILAIQPADVKAQLALETRRSVGDAAGDDKLLALLGRPDVDIDLKVGKLLPLVQQVAAGSNDALVKRGLTLARELRRVHPDEAKAAVIEGDLLYHGGQLPAAAAAYAEAVQLDDGIYDVWERLLITLFRDNQMTDLRSYAEEALDLYPNRPAVYIHYALGEAFRADYDEAQNLLMQADLMATTNPQLSAVVTETGKFIDLLRGTSDEKPDLASVPAGAEGPVGTYLALRAGRNINPDRPGTNALLLELLGDRARKEGDRAAAADLYARARAAGGKSPTLATKLAETKS